MSWADAFRSVMPALSVTRLLGVVALAAPLVAGCSGDGSGFRPMYAAPLDGGPSLDEKLASVEFGRIPGRVGQRIRNELSFQATGGGDRAPPRYKLEVILKERVLTTLVERDGKSRGQVYTVDADFRLISTTDKAVILTGASFGRASFERFTSIYANVRAREDAENRVARTIATDIRSRLAAFLSARA